MNDGLIAEIKKLLREEVAKMVPVLKSAVRSEVKDIVLSENSKSQRELNSKLEAIIAAKEQHSQLALTLQETIASATSLVSELAESQRSLKALAATGANAGGSNPFVYQAELSRWISEGKYEESFTLALRRNDVSIVSWLCSQVDLRQLLAMSRLPLSQGVLLSLLQQLACDITKDTSRKLAWMSDVVAAINPSDQLISVHARPIFTQVYQILHELPTATEPNVSAVILLTHNISYLLTRLSDSAQRTRK